MFGRIISIDWSGGENKTETDNVNIRVAEWNGQGSCIVRPPNALNARRKWNRHEVRVWLTQRLQPHEPRTLVAADFGFGLPWRSDVAIFGVNGWRAMIAEVARIYIQNETARKTAVAINAISHLNNHGPYRLSKNDRTDFQFYLNHDVAYYRLTDLAIPQAISQWYLGAGAKVGFHSITGMYALDWLIKQRDAKNASFEIWPHETLEPSGHVIVESYPSITPNPGSWGPTQGGDERDAWKMLEHCRLANEVGSIGNWFSIDERSFGRYAQVPFFKQIQFEGFIFGVT